MKKVLGFAAFLAIGCAWIWVTGDLGALIVATLGAVLGEWVL